MSMLLHIPVRILCPFWETKDPWYQIDCLLSPHHAHVIIIIKMKWKKKNSRDINLHLPDVCHNLVNFIFKSLVLCRVYPFCLTPNDPEGFADNQWYPFHTSLVQFWCIVYHPWWLELVGLRCQFCWNHTKLVQIICFMDWLAVFVAERPPRRAMNKRKACGQRRPWTKTRCNSDERIGTVKIKTIGTMAWQLITRECNWSYWIQN